MNAPLLDFIQEIFEKGPEVVLDVVLVLNGVPLGLEDPQVEQPHTLRSR